MEERLDLDGKTISTAIFMMMLVGGQRDLMAWICFVLDFWCFVWFMMIPFLLAFLYSF